MWSSMMRKAFRAAFFTAASSAGKSSMSWRRAAVAAESSLAVKKSHIITCAEHLRLARQPAAARIIGFREVGRGSPAQSRRTSSPSMSTGSWPSGLISRNGGLRVLEAREEIHRHPRVVDLEEGEEQANLVAVRRQLEIVEGDRRRGRHHDAPAPSAVPNLSPFSLSQRR